MKYYKLIDNERVTLADTLREIAPQYQHLSIATGYWDLQGTLEILGHIKGYESIRLLIGQEPLSHRLQSSFKIDVNDPKNLFPDADIKHDLVEAGRMSSEINKLLEQLRAAAVILSELIRTKKLEVKVFRKPRLHAKAYIFGTHSTRSAIGIVGSSNFTHAGLRGNRELNALEDNNMIVQFSPQTPEQQHGHLSWFDIYWNDPEAVEWTGDFSQIIQNSPVGDLTFGPYDVYIKTLMEVFPDELIPPQELGRETEDVLYSFQNRNAGILLNKLNKMGVAMLSDSVGLGKTITAGAVIKHYRDNGGYRLIVIAPAALKQQWRDDLGAHFGLTESVDFKVISLQDLNAIEQLIEDTEKPWMRPVDLFVLDEAHNLRAAGSTRYQAVERLFQSNPDSHVLLLTATPINNSLMDFANQIQLGSKGGLSSVNVPYINANAMIEWRDFFNALQLIQSEVKKAEKEGVSFDWEKNRSALAAGLRHYLVRSTRQGVEAEGGILLKDGTKYNFPSSIVEQIDYQYTESMLEHVYDGFSKSSDTVFEGLSPCFLNLDTASELTQQTSHPLDFFKHATIAPIYLIDQFDLDPDKANSLFLKEELRSVIPNIFQVINFLGFAPYRPDIYKHRYYGKAVQQIRDLGLSTNEKRKLQIQLVVHNILHVTWLKRMESSSASLLKSVEYYLNRIILFKKYLDKGYIVTLSDANTLEKEYEADIDQAFLDYDKYLEEIQAVLDSGGDVEEIKKRGIERQPADPNLYNIEAIQKDLARDERIAKLLMQILTLLSKPENNVKLQELASYIEGVANSGKYGNKVLVFSFFSDTIDYLRDNLSQVIKGISHFTARSGFITGKSLPGTEALVRRFAPKSKKYTIKPDEREIDFLFATDILSEGQNLQDAGILINYDLHWNPVRMIQRNGRINRLGSSFREVVIANAKPHSDLELYLRLVRRLERKIDTIKNTIGTDQSVLGEKENPIEFIDYYDNDKVKASAAAKAAVDAVEGEIDILEFTDEFAFELRRFLADHGDDGEVERIKDISFGKWNYLPDQADRKGEVCLVLQRIIGKTSITGTPINETMFVKVDTKNKQYPAEVIEDAEALALIRTIPEDNERSKDNINVDRYIVARRSATISKTKAESPNTRFELKPKQVEALATIRKYVPPDVDLQGIVRTGIRNRRHQRDFEELARLINRNVKEQGSVVASTISRFEKLINQLRNIQVEDRNVEETESCLFYHSRR